MVRAWGRGKGQGFVLGLGASSQNQLNYPYI